MSARHGRRGVVAALISGVCAAGLWGCVGSPTGALPIDQAGKPADGCGARIFLVRGLWDVFSLGLNDLEAKFRGEGFQADALSGGSWRDLLADLIAAHDAGVRTPLVLGGHSYGADDVIELARQLQKRDIGVELLLLIDATDPGAIPANVRRCVHYYLPNPLGNALPGTFSGNPVVPAADNTTTEIVNIVASVESLGPSFRGVDHFGLEENGALHAALIQEVFDLCDWVAGETAE